MKNMRQLDSCKNLPSLLAKVDPTDRELLDAAKAFYQSNCEHSSIREAVQNANDELGTDFATALLYTHFAAQLCSDSISNTTLSSPSTIAPPLVVIAPGAFHREHPEAGGDGRLVKLMAERNGWECASLPTESLGTLEVNARAIVEWFDKNSDRKVILVSLSKGTADVMVALAKRPDLAERIDGWISVSGISFGTRMSNWLLEKKRLRPALCFMLWRHRADIQAVRDLRVGAEGCLPRIHDQLLQSQVAEIPTFHIVGFPLRRHLSNFRSRLWHRRLLQQGPNDSVILLEDLLDYYGTIVPVWGADHYLKSAWDPTVALQAIIENIRHRKDQEEKTRSQTGFFKELL